MSKKTSLKTKELLIEICPECNTLHVYDVNAGLIEHQKNVPCGTILKEAVPGSKEKDILCEYAFKPDEYNIFTIRRWSYRERQKFYNLVGAFDQPITPGSTESMKLNIKPEIMDQALQMGVTNSPSPLKTKTDLDNTELDGAILEALYTEILDFNMPPLAQPSALRRRSTQTTQRSARATS
jgi:hypothetical protein